MALNGTQFHGYTVTRTLGEGEFGVVKLGCDERGNVVALKVINKAKLTDKTNTMIQRELAVMKLLDHDHIVRMHKAIDTPNELILVMEYCSGGEIFDYLVAHGRMQEKEARKFFRQLLMALDYCHRLRIIHRDLKLENILLDENLNVKIADFGFANVFSKSKLLHTFCGSPSYAAPEIVNAVPYTGPEVDMWSLGVMLYVLVGGRMPFEAPDVKSLFAKISSGNFKMRSVFSEELQSMLKGLMEVDPKKRFTVEDAREHVWTNIGYEEIMPATSFKVEDAEVDHEVVDRMADLGYKRLEVLEALQNKAESDVTATYAVLVGVKNKKKSGEKLPDAKPPATQRRRHERSFSMGEGTAAAAAARKAAQSNHRGLHPAPSPQATLSPSGSHSALPPSSPAARPPTGRRRLSVDAGPAGVPAPIEAPLPPMAAAQKRSGHRHRRHQSIGGDTLELKAIRETHRPVHGVPTDAPGQLPPLSKNEAPTRRRRKSSVGEEGKGVLSSLKDRIFGDTESAEPRAVRFAFSLSTTSTKTAAAVRDAVRKNLADNNFTSTESGWTFVCEDPRTNVKFEVEVCRIPRVLLNGIRFKRVSGNPFDYKKACATITDSIAL